MTIAMSIERSHEYLCGGNEIVTSNRCLPCHLHPLLRHQSSRAQINRIDSVRTVLLLLISCCFSTLILGCGTMQQIGTSGVTSTSAAPMLSALSCSNSTMNSAGTDTCTLTLTAAAPNGGLSVSLTSNHAAVTVPSTVTVPADATSIDFAATVTSVSSAQTVTLQANTSSVSRTYTLQLIATMPVLSVNATSVVFGNVQVNAAATQSVTLASTGTAAVTVSKSAVTGTGFTISGITTPITFATGETATLNLQFEPNIAGSASGQVTIVSDSATDATTTINLSGTGTAIDYRIDLAWDAPTDSTDPIVGYNVYRSPSGSSTYARLNSSIVTNTAYTDSTVVSGQTYDCMIKSVDAAGVESSPSNTTTISIP
jgi:hypothetical protein